MKDVSAPYQRMRSRYAARLSFAGQPDQAGQRAIDDRTERRPRQASGPANGSGPTRLAGTQGGEWGFEIWRCERLRSVPDAG